MCMKTFICNLCGKRHRLTREDTWVHKCGLVVVGTKYDKSTIVEDRTFEFKKVTFYQEQDRASMNSLFVELVKRGANPKELSIGCGNPFYGKIYNKTLVVHTNENLAIPLFWDDFVVLKEPSLEITDLYD